VVRSDLTEVGYSKTSYPETLFAESGRYPNPHIPTCRGHFFIRKCGRISDSYSRFFRLGFNIPHVIRIFLCSVALLLVCQGGHAADLFAYTEPYRTIEVSAADAGILTSLEVKEGDPVKKEQLLAKLDVGVIEQDLNIAREELKLKESRFEKLKALAESGRASQDEFERAEAEYNIDRFKVQRIEAALERKILRSPVDGVVSRILRDVSESVSAANPHVMTVVELDRLLVNIYVNPDKARNYVRGAVETLYSYSTKDAIPATVEFVSPVTDAATNTVRVKFVIDNSGGQFASGDRISLEPPEN